MATTLTRQDSQFFDTQLSNGLQLLGQKIPGVQSAASVFWVNTGTRDEIFEEMGVSHFLEHMAFRRTPRMTGEEVDRAFEEMGAEHNAGTWLEMTFYWCRVLRENVTPAVELLADLTHPVLDAEDFAQERNVILEEIARYQDMPSHILMSNFLRDFFVDHPLAWETLGTSESINELTVEQMRRYWDRNYGTSNILFAVAGNFDWDQVVGQVEALSSSWQRGEPTVRRLPASFSPGLHVHTSDQFSQQQIAIGTPCVDRSDPHYYTAAVMAVILGDDTGSRLYWALQHPGIAESASSSIYEFEDNGLFMTHLVTEPGMAPRALTVAREELRRMQQSDVAEDELERAKAKLNSAVVIGGESTNERVMGLIRSWLTLGRLETLEEVRGKIDAVTAKDIRHLVETFPLDPDQVITATGPVSETEIAAVL